MQSRLRAIPTQTPLRSGPRYSGALPGGRLARPERLLEAAHPPRQDAVRAEDPARRARVRILEPQVGVRGIAAADLTRIFEDPPQGLREGERVPAVANRETVGEPGPAA